MDEQIDRVFQQVPDMPAGLAEKIRINIQLETKPVKPMMSGGVYTVLFACLFAAVAVVFASVHGMYGWRVLSHVEAFSLLTALAVLAVAAGAMVARSMRPGSGALHGRLLVVLAFVAYEVLVITFFRDYSTRHFVRLGLICLLLGVACGGLLALPLWVIVRRGFVVESTRAGAVLGLISGLAGLTALTLECPLTTTPHAAIWHAGVIFVCVGLGSLLGRVLSRRF